MVKQLSHIGIAVKNLENSILIYEKLLNTKLIHKEFVPDQKVMTAIFRLGNVIIELLEPTSVDSPISKFLEKRGEGIHHISLEVENIEEELRRLQNNGIQLIDEKPKPGAADHSIAFLHPKSTNGVLIELSQKIK